MTGVVLTLVVDAELMGIRLRLADGKLKAAFPASARHEVAPLLARLKEHRDQVVKVLGRRIQIPPMPPGVRLLAWEPKQAPVLLERWSVVIDVALFARRTLEQLEAALDGKNWLAGNWSARELVDRLEQVGVVVEFERS